MLIVSNRQTRVSTIIIMYLGRVMRCVGRLNNVCRSTRNRHRVRRCLSVGGWSNSGQAETVFEMRRPARIILIRHGQSLGNLDEGHYVNTADWQIPLSEMGVEQAVAAGKELKELIKGHVNVSVINNNTFTCTDQNVFFYCSPYLRTRQTCDCIKQAFEPHQLLGQKEEPRVAEQQFGNFQNVSEMQAAKKERNFFGRFFYR